MNHPAIIAAIATMMRTFFMQIPTSLFSDQIRTQILTAPESIQAVHELIMHHTDGTPITFDVEAKLAAQVTRMVETGFSLKPGR